MITSFLVATTLALTSDASTEVVINYVNRKGKVSCLTEAGTPLAGMTDLGRTDMKKLCTADCATSAQKEAKPFYFPIKEKAGATDSFPKGMARIKIKDSACWLDLSQVRIMKINEGLKGRDIACAAGSTAASFGSHKCEG
ncbi:hypothetical protein HK107_00350 [Parvularcula sp. ZS-1/3]|uniref:Uncharacterized protein n=1 Tax=Parvularcula mediterranea TaxID=2732508 RepID=A0A7Y3RJP2_9PROT|nr:hypothetical protein [Parvularcula mediterranea]NNU14771.1 hypothetical protein [Parvularcula mediterranea]